MVAIIALPRDDDAIDLVQELLAVAFEQSCRVAHGGRSRITLAKSASGNSAPAILIASIASDDLAEPQPA